MQFINHLLEQTKAVPITEPITSTGYFHQLLTQEFKVGVNRFRREYVINPDVVIVLPVTTSGKILTIFQPVALSDEGSLIEFPAGYIEDGEFQIDAVKRELLEETGYGTDKVYSLGKFYQSPGLLKNRIFSFIAFDCTPIQEPKRDVDENMISYEMEYKDFIKLIEHGNIYDANTLITFYHAKNRKYLTRLEN